MAMNFQTEMLKVRQSRKQIMVTSIVPKNERWDNFQYSQVSIKQASSFNRDLRVHKIILTFIVILMKFH